jgi:membrane-bound inhibitor of C-type lysozyme
MPPKLLLPPRVRATLLVAVAVAALTACAAEMKRREDEEAARNTIECLLSGERLLIRQDVGEVRLLLPGGDRVALYQIPAASGARYSNGDMELRGKGMEQMLIRNGAAVQLVDCKPYVLPPN